MAEAKHDAASHAAATLPWAEIFEWAQALLSGGLILTGAFFVIAGAIGILRMPDFYTRIHAAGMTDTMGAEFILLGLIIQSGFTQTSLKLLLIAFFLFITSPTATHAIAHAAHLSGLKPKLGPYQAPDLDDIGKGDGS